MYSKVFKSFPISTVRWTHTDIFWKTFTLYLAKSTRSEAKKKKTIPLNINLSEIHYEWVCEQHLRLPSLFFFFYWSSLLSLSSLDPSWIPTATVHHSSTLVFAAHLYEQIHFPEVCLLSSTVVISVSFFMLFMLPLWEERMGLLSLRKKDSHWN